MTGGLTPGRGRYAFTVEQPAVERPAGRLDPLRVLDAGCGTGRLAAALERRAAQLAGVDPGPVMLTVAAQRVRAPLRAADAGELPFRDAAFDVTIAVTVCEFAASPAALVAELARVTRPGGRVVIGALNCRGAWGLARRRQLRRPPPRQAARFLTRRQLRALGAPHGRVRLRRPLIMPGAVPGSRHASLYLEAAAGLSRRQRVPGPRHREGTVTAGRLAHDNPAGPAAARESQKSSGMNGGAA
jgi:SAM-dependent methyltransferase